MKIEVNRVLNILFNNGYATAEAEKPEIIRYESNEEALFDKVNVKFIFNPKLKYTFGPTKITFR